MSITAEEIKKLALLSRIELSPDEAYSMQHDISSILGYIEKLNQADFSAIKSNTDDRKNIWREDKDMHESGRFSEKLLSNAPGREGQYVKVKKIL